MKLASFLGFAFVAALATAAPQQTTTSYVPNIIMVSPGVYGKIDFAYSGQHEIVSITVPLNAVNFENKAVNQTGADISVFFVEADINKKGEKEYKGLYLLKGGKATKILETGTDSAADRGDSKDVYISATDGLYVYDSDSGKVKRYGSITDNLISVVKLNSKNELYILTADNIVYKVTDNGKKKVKVNEIKQAKQIVIDSSDNLYYYCADKQAYVLTKNGVKKIEGLPANPSFVALYRAPFLYDDKATILSNDRMYYMQADGKSIMSDATFQDRPSAVATEAMFVMYYSFGKHMYIIKLPNLTLLDDTQKLFKDKAEDIQLIASRVRGA